MRTIDTFYSAENLSETDIKTIIKKYAKKGKYRIDVLKHNEMRRIKTDLSLKEFIDKISKKGFFRLAKRSNKSEMFYSTFTYDDYMLFCEITDKQLNKIVKDYKLRLIL